MDSNRREIERRWQNHGERTPKLALEYLRVLRRSGIKPRLNRFDTRQLKIYVSKRIIVTPGHSSVVYYVRDLSGSKTKTCGHSHQLRAKALECAWRRAYTTVIATENTKILCKYLK